VTTPTKERSRESFLTRVDRGFTTDPIDDTAKAVSAVFGLLSEKISGGEIADVRQALPHDLRALWPAPTQTPARATAAVR
jgi:uncharacterized protein (DUF2267 family)